jgi:DNA replication protein DnaC
VVKLRAPGPDPQEIAERREQERLQRSFDHPEDELERSGVGKRYLSCSFETFQGGEQIKTFCEGLIEKATDLVLIGNTGSGKTHLAVSILREHVKRDRKGQFITVPELLMEIRKSYKGDSFDDESRIMGRYAEASLLVLDDLGAEKTTDWSVDRLYLIIDRRYREAMPTIITTNLTLDEIGKNISMRISSRLSGMKVVRVNLPDWRKKR